MTRHPSSQVVLEHAVFGAAGAERLVIVLREGPTATTDPDALVTVEHDVRVLAVRVTTADDVDTATYGGETPAASAVDTLEALVVAQVDLPPRPFGLVAVAGATAVGTLLAERLGPAVDRLALVAAPAPASPLERSLAADALGRLAVDTLVVDGVEGPSASAPDADFYLDALPDARAVLLPDQQTGLGLGAAWELVLDHVAG